jgi:hypothetical protein
MTTRTNVGLWAPTNETVAAIGSAVCAHWAAAKAVARNQFWPKASNWLDVPRHHLTMGGKLMRYASGSASVPNPNRVPRS